MTNKTIQYYNEKADEFITNTFTADVSSDINKFIQKINPNGKILDVGCGSGRDTLTFKNLGFNVVAFDASEELVKIASKTINHHILHMDMMNIEWEKEFDGIWAMASLLHLEKRDLPIVLNKLVNALKDDGFLFISLKQGIDSGFDDKGRFFSYYQKDELEKILKDIHLDNIEFSANKDNLGRNLSWISFIAQKNGLNLQNKQDFINNKLKM